MEADANCAPPLAVRALEAALPTALTKPCDPPGDGELRPGAEAWSRDLPVSAIQPEDASTKDSWVPRHPDLIRLTGRHPFNCEPPPARLFESYITPASLHFVRNHGAVPQISWEEHRVAVNGLVDSPAVLTMGDLLAMPSIDVTCTITCAGNRRKEQNMQRQTIGFSWGPAGTGCSTWTGVRLADVLRACGVRSPERGARYVCIRGPKAELPKGEDGSYGTSITIHKALDPASDVILAYRQNGRLLTPDHGYPVRLIVPGYIGGRMVKWLEEVTVTEVESQNFYHFHDNRVLPSHVDEGMADAEGWWYRPDYLINDLSINSAIGFPGHGEVVPLAPGAYAVKGYAYAGAGTKIIRCEVSLDDGQSWRLADIFQRTEPNAYGKHWAWVWWQISIPIAELLTCPEIMCRAWDSSMNTQPSTFTWNVMGMLNNCCYRVKIHPVPTAAGGLALRFEHPTVAGPTPGGWMMRGGDAALAAPAQVPVLAAASRGSSMRGSSTRARFFTMAQVGKHAGADSAWFVVDGRVYDGTAFLEEHPGGADSILLVAGTDASAEFNAIHSAKAKAMLLEHCIGDLEGAPSSDDDASAAPTPAADGAPPVALDPKKRLPFRLAEKEALSHNVTRFRFALPTPAHRLGLPVGKHLFISAEIDGEAVERAYTPTSSDEDLGHFDLVVKVYRGGEHPGFPGGGAMSQWLHRLAVGERVEVTGPAGRLEYLGRGRLALDGRPPRAVRRINMIAGGTGITPMYQMLKAILKDSEDPTEISLLYANVTPADVLLWRELDALAAAHARRLRVWYTVDKPEAGWAYSSGRVDLAMLRERLFPAGEGTVCTICGPLPMVKFACLPSLEALGYKHEDCICF